MMSIDDIGIVALGSNLPGKYGSSLELLAAAVAKLPAAGFRVVQVSTLWVSPAWPNPADPAYLNGIALVETRLSPRAALAALLCLERNFGRTRGSKNSPRTLDLDLIAFGRECLSEEGLILPHPRAHLRRFVMGPLAEIAPEWIHPLLDRSAFDLAREASIGAEARPLKGF